jgi:DNA-binding CsgD family transcriptional regulator
MPWGIGRMQSLPQHFADRLLASIRSVIPLAGASCYCVDLQGRPFGHRLDGLPVEQLREYRAGFCDSDPFHPRLHAPAAADVVGFEEAGPTAEPARYLKGFLQRHGYCDEVEMFFRDAEGRIAIGIGLLRDERNGRFRRSDIDMLRRLRPLLELALAEHIGAEGEAQNWRQSLLVQKLTRRETQILEHLLRGASNREIADLCDVTIATVKAHFFNIFAKAGVSSRTELVTRLLGH